jgi:hypothetical protein
MIKNPFALLEDAEENPQLIPKEHKPKNNKPNKPNNNGKKRCDCPLQRSRTELSLLTAQLNVAEESTMLLSCERVYTSMCTLICANFAGLRKGKLTNP